MSVSPSERNQNLRPIIWVRTLFAPQRYDYLLVASEKNHPPVLDRLDRNLIELIAELQPKLLTFADGLSIDDSETRTGIERNRANDKCIGRDLCPGIFHAGVRNFGCWFPPDRPKRVTCFGFLVEGGAMFQFNLWRLFSEHGHTADEKAEKKDLFHFLPIMVSAVMETC